MIVTALAMFLLFNNVVIEASEPMYVDQDESFPSVIRYPREP